MDAVGPARDLEDYLAHLGVERGLSPHTLAAYRRDLSRYAAYLGALGRARLSDVRPADVDAYVEALRTGSDGGSALSASSASRAVVAVRGWHRFAMLEGIAPSDPAVDVRPPSTTKRLPKAIAVEDVERLLVAASAGDGPGPLRDRALLELLYGTGARITEATSLAVDDIDLDDDAGSVRLFGKGRRERVVPLGRFARDAVDAYLVRARPVLAQAGTGTPALFLGMRGRPLSRQSAWAILQSAARRADLEEHVSPHTLRHSYATHLLAGGADVRVVQELLGHASVTTTQLYTLVTAQTLREVYAAAHPRARG
ncbi:tyrosine recombinase XerD [Beutenbergia cavernae DSM 12333]|uniref:Tyrosine recombinase XerD n=1 Tax=Beutenbergia cavernae (strain ATCC BAA-8 / DSM 12333 / CCUG 43141 / JCM 11478 / NBRC 16432 / NCIMB 13614 / HKI 0122) TaxID=471853 RepID=C5C6K5_BEUC1|nr:site-specific tyrosine recombinase XerD [Beutenbergia cavernae]ACQ80411.1 tyrosine recombinase XerD [Beutenbergia cavernae DSM 12333]